MSDKAPKLAEIAKRITAHLQRFAGDPDINQPRAAGRTKPYYNPGAYASGARIGVTYVSYQGATTLTKAEALKYLTWLDAGNVGRHYTALKET